MCYALHIRGNSQQSLADDLLGVVNILGSSHRFSISSRILARSYIIRNAFDISQERKSYAAKEVNVFRAEVIIAMLSVPGGAVQQPILYFSTSPTGWHVLVVWGRESQTRSGCLFCRASVSY